MRSLWPLTTGTTSGGGALDEPQLLALYSQGAEVPKGHSFVRVNMITTLDGAVAFGGRSGAIGGPADQRVFLLLRSLADVVLVGAGTVRGEGYGPVRLPPEVQEVRVANGQPPLPPVAVVTQSARLDWGGRLFSGSDHPRTLVIAPAGAGQDARLDAARPVADVVTAGSAPGPVDLVAALGALAERGLHHVLCEGGPGLNTSLVAAGAVDELCLTLSPKLAGCVGGNLVGGWLGSGAEWLARTAPEAAGATGQQAPLARLAELSLVHVLEEDGFLFLRHRARYGPSRAGSPSSDWASPASPSGGG